MELSVQIQSDRQSDKQAARQKHTLTFDNVCKDVKDKLNLNTIQVNPGNCRAILVAIPVILELRLFLAVVWFGHVLKCLCERTNGERSRNNSLWCLLSSFSSFLSLSLSIVVLNAVVVVEVEVDVLNTHLVLIFSLSLPLRLVF